MRCLLRLKYKGAIAMGTFFLPGKINAIKNGSNINQGVIVFNSNKYNFRISGGDISFNIGDLWRVFSRPVDFSTDRSTGTEAWDMDVVDKTENI